MKARKILQLILLLIGFFSNVKAQSNGYKCYYEVGKPCPDFTFKNVIGYPKSTVSLKDFKGKWLILDFWNKNCSSCIQSFPRIYQEQQEFKENIQFLLIGQQDRAGEVQPLFASLKKKMHFDLPCVFDSVLVDFNDSHIRELEHGMPFIVVIDPDGIVRGSGATLHGKDLSIGADLKMLTPTNRPLLHDVYREKYIDDAQKYIYNDKKDFLINNNGGPDSVFLFRSVLAKWDKRYNAVIPKKFPENGTNFFIAGINIPWLYMFAFFENKNIAFDDSLYTKVWPWPIMELSADTLKKIGYNWIGTEGRLYSYGLAIKGRTFSKNEMMTVMQNDLKNYFRYQATIEERKMPCWSLIITDETKVKRSRSDNEQPSAKYYNGHQGVRATKLPMSKLIVLLIIDTHIDDPRTLSSVLIDDTGIDKIDIDIDFTPYNFESIRQALQKNGLDIVPTERTFKTLVIRDPQTKKL